MWAGARYHISSSAAMTTPPRIRATVSCSLDARILFGLPLKLLRNSMAPISLEWLSQCELTMGAGLKQARVRAACSSNVSSTSHWFRIRRTSFQSRSLGKSKKLHQDERGTGASVWNCR